MYKDKDKQKEAKRLWAEKNRGSTKKVEPLEVVPEKVVPLVVPESSTVKPTRHWNQAVDLPGDDGYKGKMKGIL